MSDENMVVCECMGITLGDLRKVIAENPGITVEELQSITDAGTICGLCVEGDDGRPHSLKSLIDEANSNA